MSSITTRQRHVTSYLDFPVLYLDNAMSSCYILLRPGPYFNERLGSNDVPRHGVIRGGQVRTLMIEATTSLFI